ncbi:MAG: hypothetical protein ACOC22_00880 [bacterium]
MNEKLKRLLYLTEYHNKANKRSIQENVERLFESKKTEAEAFNILKRNMPRADEVELNSLLNQFKQMDVVSKNQILLPIIATMYAEEQDIHRLKRTVDSINNLMRENKIRTIFVNNDGKYEIDGKTYDNYLRLTEYIHSLEGMDKGLDRYEKDMAITTTTDEKPLFENDNIAIYDGNDIGKCISYGKGDLTGRTYKFCIGDPDPSRSMWQTYRDNDVSTFYYVLDKTRDLNDPLHMVVVDHQQYDNFLLTDATNNTGSIAEYGSDFDAYFNYLKTKGVDVDKVFKHKPITDEERRINALIGQQNPSLEWFRNLDPDPLENFKLQMNYIGRGHRLSDEQFKYLWGLYETTKGAFALLMKYVDLGLPLPKKQFNILVGKETI